MLSWFSSLFQPKMVNPEVKKKVLKIIEEHPVFVASKSYCPYCTQTKNTLSDLDVDAYILELDIIDGGSDIQDALAEITGQRTVPNIFIAKEHIGGNSDLQALKRKGSLDQKLAKALSA